MEAGWRRRRWSARVKEGDGRALKRFRWWQVTLRSVMSITLPVDGRPVVHTIEVKHGGDAVDGVVRAGLYLDGVRRQVSRLPARFPVAGGHIEVRVSPAGLRRCHFVGDDGREQALTPDPRSAEGRRRRLARNHPLASGLLGALSIVLLLVGIGLNALQLAEPLSEIPLVAETLGTFESPLRLSTPVNLALALGAAFGAVERASRLRYHWLLDGGAGT